MGAPNIFYRKLKGQVKLFYSVKKFSEEVINEVPLSGPNDWKDNDEGRIGIISGIVPFIASFNGPSAFDYHLRNRLKGSISLWRDIKHARGTLQLGH